MKEDNQMLLAVGFVILVFAIATIYANAVCHFTPEEKDYVNKCEDRGLNFESFTKTKTSVSVHCKGEEIEWDLDMNLSLIDLS